MSATAPQQSGTTVAVGRAFRQAGAFDRAKISARAGAISAVPVTVALAIGAAVNSPTVAVTMALGALLPGIAWRAGEAPAIPPIGIMAGAGTGIALAALLGTLSAHWWWVHLIVLVIVCLVAGGSASLGRRGLVIGTQSLIGFIVFGRFPQSLTAALVLTGYVLAGAALQVGVAASVAVPLAWRRQRTALSGAYRSLEALAADLRPRGLSSATALDAAEQLIAAPALFADQDRDTLADLVGLGRRLRLELAALAALVTTLERTDPELAAACEQPMDAALDRVRALLSSTVAAIEGDAVTLKQLPTVAADLAAWDATREPLPSAALDQRLAALIGQVTAAARLAAALRVPGSSASPLPAGRPTRGTGQIGRRIARDVQRMRTGVTMYTAAGRHALRLAVAVAVTELLIQHLALPRAYWAVVSTATVLRPGFGATFTRGAERMLGTCVGVVIATLLAVAIDPSGWGVVAVVGILAYFTYLLFPASFALGVAMMTVVVVFMLHAVSPDTAQTALDRGIDTALGGAIGLIAYALWPTWSALATGPLLGSLVDAQHAYLDAVLTGLESGQQLPQEQLAPLARNARVAFADAQAAIGLARSEPIRGGADPARAGATLTALRRVVWAVHMLRLDAGTIPERRPAPELATVHAGLGQALSDLSASLRAEPPPTLFPPLRSLHRQLARSHPQLLSQSLWAALDELIDATDTAAATVGLTVP